MIIDIHTTDVLLCAVRLHLIPFFCKVWAVWIDERGEDEGMFSAMVILVVRQGCALVVDS